MRINDFRKVLDQNRKASKRDPQRPLSLCSMIWIKPDGPRLHEKRSSPSARKPVLE
ncbi:hypothetical protein HMPREF9440_01878 [Sutterella parvirubra YIT 11816]|uniref:Uncharacterized protein n=1 Tax=Sutterella parvirubra YIT 11816 TaxID=762967 RepID=H3KGJ8_9BURK|nr:hypothetical protein HMPREF9440_01878 [Sutterella parvirubra YIT 11816]